MALSKNNIITASDINALKARVKAEMQRRKYTGSLTTYASASYDYNSSTAPATGRSILAEHQQKIVTPMRAVNSSTVGVTAVNSGASAVALDGLSSILSDFEGKSLTTTAHGCKAACSGLCASTCGDNCSTNCLNTCSGTCSNTCSGSCSGGCYLNCGDGCSSCTSCSGTCKGTCAGCSSTCKGTCSGSCETSCSVGCRNTAKVSQN